MTRLPQLAGGPVGATALVVLGLIAQEAGAALAVLLFPSAGPLGMVTFRLVFSALILLAIARPSWRGRSTRAWATVVAFGAVLAIMNGLFYLSLDRIPLGAAVTIEVLGPLVLSVIASRRASAWLWAGLAAVGVVLLGQGSFGHLDPLGILLAAGAGVGWMLYILLSARTGAEFARLDGLAIAMAIGGVMILPFGIATSGSALVRPDLLLLGAAVALLSSAIPYALELIALRRLHASTFAVLLALAPAIATLAGLVFLGQTFTWVGAIAVGLVVAASIGAVRSAPRGGAPAEPAP
ncbi:EamA family transporter [Agromyces aerolatus]|uniref:EamA family transporter n=1 Tax=Agromyces sp. LY-1074 TaxID=3074080 RepID=UPI00285A797C|nr:MULTISPECIES: EamA family transporter [unclassified Agromyces]MDR5698669.1 EamA family transporter [Agromyces sp. LY-1074]MDR5704963.1 EamA family transporter [Agromyces sp. LY-1358]